MPAAHISPYAGTWYPERASELEKLLDDCFARPACAPTPSGALGFIVPHAAPQWSGPVAAAVYREIERQRPERIVVLGFPHRGGLRGVAVPDVSVIRTPLGPLPLEPLGFPAAPEACLCDHSFEIQIPFLQRAAPSAAVTGLYVGPMSSGERAEWAARLAALWRPGTVFLASSDFTHYGPQFGYVPFPEDRKTASRLHELDFECIDAVGSIDPALFQDSIAASGATVCGVDPIALLLGTIDRLASGRAFLEVLDYRTSGEIGNDFRHSVSYAALGIYPREAFCIGEPDAEALLDSAERTLALLRASRRREPVPVNGSPALDARRGVFVSLHRDGELLGCVGNATGRKSLVADTPQTVLAAALDDHRFGPAALSGGAVDIEISILTPLRRLGDPSRFCCGRDGGLLEIGRKAGLLLPQVADGRGWSAEDFLAALARKSLLGPRAWRDPRARLSVFEAQIFSRPGRPGRS
jgi:MEMO1 family protein